MKHEEEELSKNKQEFLRQYKALKNNQGGANIDVELAKKNSKLLGNLLAGGIIDAQGRPMKRRQE